MMHEQAAMTKLAAILKDITKPDASLLIYRCAPAKAKQFVFKCSNMGQCMAMSPVFAPSRHL